MENQLLINLLSGLVGSIIGAVIGAWATLKTSKDSLDAVYKQEKKRRDDDEKKHKISVIHGLLKELKENQAIAQDWQNKTNKVLMSREAWATFKGETFFMPQKLQGNLPYTYYLVSEYNSFVEYDRMNLFYGSGYVDDKMKTAAEKIAGNVGGVISQLENLLK